MPSILPSHVTFNGVEYQTPDEAQIAAWMNDSVCETPDGDTVEPDHPDSWLRLLGLM